MLNGTSECFFLSRQRLWSTGIITSIVIPCSKSSLYCRFSCLCTILAFLTDTAERKCASLEPRREADSALAKPLATWQPFSLLRAAEIAFPFLGLFLLLQFEECVCGQSYKAMMSSAPSRAALFQGNTCQWLSINREIYPREIIDNRPWVSQRWPTKGRGRGWNSGDKSRKYY